MKLAEEMKKDDIIVVTLSGRGDKDVEIVQDYLNKNNIKKKTKNAK
jgi:tryptophan synthase beta chain